MKKHSLVRCLVCILVISFGYCRVLFDFGYDEPHLPRLQWGASAWQRGDFILHLAGCPLVEPPCRQTFEEVAQWVEDAHAEPSGD